MILCRRNTEEWVRWQSPIQMLPEQTFHSVAEEMGGRAPESNGTPLVKDERIRALGRQLKQTLQIDLQPGESTRIQSGALWQPR
jgi:hypothetical protein